MELVLLLDRLFALLVFFRVLFGVTGHLVDLFLRETRRTTDGNLLILAGTEIFSGDVENAVGIDVKGDFDLRCAARSGRNAIETECTENLVIARHRTLAL